MVVANLIVTLFPAGRAPMVALRVSPDSSREGGSGATGAAGIEKPESDRGSSTRGADGGWIDSGRHLTPGSGEQASRRRRNWEGSGRSSRTSPPSPRPRSVPRFDASASGSSWATAFKLESKTLRRSTPERAGLNSPARRRPSGRVSSNSPSSHGVSSTNHPRPEAVRSRTISSGKTWARMLAGRSSMRKVTFSSLARVSNGTPAKARRCMASGSRAETSPPVRAESFSSRKAAPPSAWTAKVDGRGQAAPPTKPPPVGTVFAADPVGLPGLLPCTKVTTAALSLLAPAYPGSLTVVEKRWRRRKSVFGMTPDPAMVLVRISAHTWKESPAVVPEFR